MPFPLLGFSFTGDGFCDKIRQRTADERARHMKRIAFFQDNLDVGGIQKSIVNLLMNFDYTDCQVDLYLSDSKSFWDVSFPKELTVKYL